MVISNKVRDWFYQNFGYDPLNVEECTCASATYNPQNEIIYHGKTRGEIDAENSALVEILSRPIPIRK